jgi:hypothetical protein
LYRENLLSKPIGSIYTIDCFSWDAHICSPRLFSSVNMFFIVLSYLLRGIGIVWLMGVILVSASLMSYILVTYAKRKRKEEISSVLSIYFTMKTSKNRSILIGNVEKQPGRIHTLHPLEKVSAIMN